MKTKYTLLTGLLVYMCGCGGGGDSAGQGDQPPPVRTIAVVDSIGVELGDSNYVMGAIEGVAYGPDGNIAVLDCARSCIRVYSPEGEYLRSISRKGNGPGELQNVAGLAISEDGTITLAGEGAGVLGFHVFDYATGEWIVSRQTQGPPSCLVGADGNTHIRVDSEFDRSSDEPSVISRVCRWEPEADDPELVYYEFSFPFEPSDMGHMISMLWDAFSIAAGNDGRVYVAPYSTEQAEVYAYERDGTEIFSLDIAYEPVLRTQEELEMERNVLRARANIMDMGPIPLEPEPCKPLIRGLGLDGDGNLWVHRGTSSVPTFDVFAPDGEPLFTAEVQGEPADGATWRVHVSGDGLLAYAEDPAAGYQKVYMLELQ